jgi:hypothetical protein
MFFQIYIISDIENHCFNISLDLNRLLNGATTLSIMTLSQGFDSSHHYWNQERENYENFY